MRWDNLTLEAEERARLPGYRDEAIVRHFDAPGSIRTRFYEIHAKSALNRVPEASRMPFRWTINPFRGCSHACSYCVAPDTPVLLGDGRHKPIRELGVGDAIYGTVRDGKYRRYALTTVLDKWATIRPAYRVTLEDGTELVTSADHRFLSDRGWKHVCNTPVGQRDRPHLTLNNRLVGTGAFAELPAESGDYRSGYVTGIVRGDGAPGSYEYAPRHAGGSRVSLFRLALTDLEALTRAREYIATHGMDTREWSFQTAGGASSEAAAIGTGRIGSFDQIERLIEWPVLPSLEWCRGFLAGIFDADGSRSAFSLRVANRDPEILLWADVCARRLGFDTKVDRDPGEDGVAMVRVAGGLSEQLRFFHTTDPAITRKRSLAGQMVKTFANLKVASVEPLGRAMRLYDITTGTGDFIANGVVSHNCFARPTHTYLDFDAGRDFEREIVVKVNAPELVRVELARPSWKGEHVALGTNTDPYQWVEGRYKLMRGIWEAMRDAENPCSVLTKSPLLLRDLDLMTQINERTEFSAALSVPTLDEKAWRATEPHTPHPRARLEAVAELTRAGIRTGVLVAPLMPGINDAPEQVEPIVERAVEAGAAYVTSIPLHLRGEVKGLFFGWLAENRPDLVDRYKELYRRGAYLPPGERDRLTRVVKGSARDPAGALRSAAGDSDPDLGWRLRSSSAGHAAAAGKRSNGLRRGTRQSPQTPLAPPRREEQQRLF